MSRKSEIRMSKSETNPKTGKLVTEIQNGLVWNFLGFDHLRLFRTSDFGFRVCSSRLSGVLCVFHRFLLHCCAVLFCGVRRLTDRRSQEGRGNNFRRRRANLRRKERAGGSGNRIQSAFRLEDAHQLRGGAGHECASGAPYHGNQVGTQGLVGYLSRFAIAPGIDARGKSLGESQLRRALPLGDQGDGNLSQRSGAGLHVAQRHRLQRQLGSQRQSAEKLSRSGGSALEPGLGGKVSDTAIRRLAGGIIAQLGQRQS